MKISNVTTTPLYLRFKEPYRWAQGTNFGAKVVLVSVHSDDDIMGYGECFGAPNCELIVKAFEQLRDVLIGKSIDQISRITELCHQVLCASQGPGNHRRLSLQISSGMEMALWDVLGKASNVPVHKLLGGAQRDRIRYFGFVQGSTPEEKAADAIRYVESGYEVIYLKVGFGFEQDMNSVAAVRGAIGDRRLRVDANESWDILTARRMIKAFSPYNLEMIEQPVNASSFTALAQLRNSVETPIAADQSVHTIQDVFQICKLDGADLIVLGMHECGGLLNFVRAAAVAESAGLNVSIHGNFESGITTCASHQAALTVRNLDDGNQIMGNFLCEDIIGSPDMVPTEGCLSLPEEPGLGFTLDDDAVSRAAEAYKKEIA